MSFRNIITPDFGRDNPLHVSWYDSTWIPALNQQNVMDYFSERSNPFYDRTCNNEMVKMQRLSPDHLTNMTGVEYILLHVQEPILYVIRKQHRHQPSQVTPMADYYILSGVVYQAPDLCSVINSRLLNSVHALKSVFDESSSFARYHQSKGYWWEFKNKPAEVKKVKEEPPVKKQKEEPSSHFQRQRVDILLGELAKNFPLRSHQPQVEAPKVSAEKRGSDQASLSSGVETGEPQEKKPKIARSEFNSEAI